MSSVEGQQQFFKNARTSPSHRNDELDIDFDRLIESTYLKYSQWLQEFFYYYCNECRYVPRCYLRVASGARCLSQQFFRASVRCLPGQRSRIRQQVSQQARHCLKINVRAAAGIRRLRGRLSTRGKDRPSATQFALLQANKIFRNHNKSWNAAEVMVSSCLRACKLCGSHHGLPPTACLTIVSTFFFFLLLWTLLSQLTY